MEYEPALYKVFGAFSAQSSCGENGLNYWLTSAASICYKSMPNIERKYWFLDILELTENLSKSLSWCVSSGLEISHDIFI